MNPAMRLHDLSHAHQDHSLGCMKGGQIGVAPGVFTNACGQDDSRPGQASARLVEMLGGFWRHRSTPSRRISAISEVRF